MYGIMWQEFSRKGEIVTKRKDFKTPEARDKFEARLTEKDSFYRVLARA